MKKIITLILILSLNHLVQSQEYNTSVSAYTSTNYTKGFEIRGEFENWYIGFNAENFLKDKEFYFGWGFSVGAFKEYNDFTFFGGAKVGFMRVNNNSKPLFGLETEIDYNISENFFIGLRGSVDIYFDSPSVEEPKTITLIRPFIKLGYKF